MFKISSRRLPHHTLYFCVTRLSHLLNVPQPLHVASSPRLPLSCYQPHTQSPRMAILVVVREQGREVAAVGLAEGLEAGGQDFSISACPVAG